MAPPKPVLSWAQRKPPATAEQRIAFLDACQREFETVRAVGPVSAQLLWPPRDDDAPPRPRPTTTRTYAALDDVPTPAPADAACAVCAGGATTTLAAVLANPFADWNVLLCARCRR